MVGRAGIPFQCSKSSRRSPGRTVSPTRLVSIGEGAVAKSNDALLNDYFTDDYKLDSPAGVFNRDEIKAYFAALRESFIGFTISRLG
jgi:hypothetical protein